MFLGAHVVREEEVAVGVSGIGVRTGPQAEDGPIHQRIAPERVAELDTHTHLYNTQ